eukprot:GEZU01032372.1.p1 GENE.GEZU01032372.1~~GEZU01032372.1.p1  ORF type:complete len:103 (+),score=6.69 GEZU01032372.1:390-698(+)
MPAQRKELSASGASKGVVLGDGPRYLLEDAEALALLSQHHGVLLDVLVVLVHLEHELVHSVLRVLDLLVEQKHVLHAGLLHVIIQSTPRKLIYVCVCVCVCV